MDWLKQLGNWGGDIFGKLGKGVDSLGPLATQLGSGQTFDEDMLRAIIQMKQQNNPGGSLPGMNASGSNSTPVGKFPSHARPNPAQGMTTGEQKFWGMGNKFGQKEGEYAIGASRGFSPEGAENLQSTRDSYLTPLPGGDTQSGGWSGGGMDPKSKMMLMVGQQLFNRSREEEQPLQPMRTSPVNVGGMTPMSGDAMRGMQMQRGNMPDFRLGGGMLSDPNIRRRRPQFLYGI